jgi:hypothetical protein
VENTPEVKPTIPSLEGFTYSRIFKKNCNTFITHKNIIFPPMSICNALTHGGDSYFNLAFINFASMKKTKFHAIPSFYSFFIIFDSWGSIGMPTK